MTIVYLLFITIILIINEIESFDSFPSNVNYDGHPILRGGINGSRDSSSLHIGIPNLYLEVAGSQESASPKPNPIVQTKRPQGHLIGRERLVDSSDSDEWPAKQTREPEEPLESQNSDPESDEAGKKIEQLRMINQLREKENQDLDSESDEAGKKIKLLRMIKTLRERQRENHDSDSELDEAGKKIKQLRMINTLRETENQEFAPESDEAARKIKQLRMIHTLRDQKNQNLDADSDEAAKKIKQLRMINTLRERDNHDSDSESDEAAKKIKQLRMIKTIRNKEDSGWKDDFKKYIKVLASRYDKDEMLDHIKPVVKSLERSHFLKIKDIDIGKRGKVKIDYEKNGK